MSKAIGGLFGAPLNNTSPPNSDLPGISGFKGNVILASHARGLIKWAFDSLDVDHFWVPSYLCPSMLAGFNGDQVCYYPVDECLSAADLSWTKKLNERDLVCVIDYFGTRTLCPVVQEARNRGALVLEDACQALLTDGTGHGADFVVYSPRKFVGVPDGGILEDRSGLLPDNPSFPSAPSEWWIPQLNAWIRRGQFDQRGGSDSDRSWFELYKLAKGTAPPEPRAISQITETLIAEAFDFQAISSKRCSNFQRLRRGLKSKSLLPSLEEGVIPLGFPLRFESNEARRAVRQRLIDNAVYPPIHWDISETVPSEFEESHSLSNKVLTIPCDQRYGIEDMNRIIDLITQT
jgi:hypothetical protein